MEETHGYNLTLCLLKLSDEDFMEFKDSLRKVLGFKPKPIPRTKIATASRRGLAMLLNKHYPGQVWDIVLSLSQRAKWKKLFDRAERLKRDERRPYKETMEIIFKYIWDFENYIHVPSHEYNIITEMQHRTLKDIFDLQLESVTAVILGNKGEGKTTFLRKAMLDWAAGDLWQNRFHYVFFFSLMSLNNITELSLAQLILSKLSESSETLEDIVSDPRRILFILEGFDYLKFDLGLQTNLCNDWRKKAPTQIVLSSLLQKVMLQESSLLLELGNLSVPKIYPLLQKPREITIGGYTEASVKYYCCSFMHSFKKGSEIFNYLQAIQLLLTLCKNPYKRWMVCRTLKCQFKRGEKLNIAFKPDSVLYTSFMVSSFRAKYAGYPSRQNRNKLMTLCTLAVEGMWKSVFVFKYEDLLRNGISESEQILWMKMYFLNTRGDCFVFYHPALQLYFAALFYFLRQDKDKHHPIIGSLPQLLREIYAHGQNQWLLTGKFVFGIATEKIAAILEPHFGFIPCEKMRQEIFKCFRSLSQGECGEKLISPQSLFDSLVENQEEQFITQVMDMFEEMTVDISSADVLSVATTCLLKSQSLKKLHLHIQQRVFSEIYNPEDGDLEVFKHEKNNAIKHWRMLCRVFQNLEVLDLDSCKFNVTVIFLLYLSMSPTHRGPLNAFKLQSFSLGKCDISSEACGVIATSLTKCKVKHLSLVENPLKNKGVMLVCEILKHPSCVLETLMLSYCCFTFIACGHLYEALLHNKYLSLLDLSSNFLEDTGVNILCEALKDPRCNLRELWLSGCYLTSDCCKAISAVLSCNQNLKTLKLGSNNIQDTGIKQLCEALRNPGCKLQCLGLDMCEFTTDSCADLALALTTCKTLTVLSLDWMTLGHNGLELLCEALNHRACNLKVLGLDKSAFCEESQILLQDVEKKNNLIILHYPWIKEENKKRGVRLVWNSKN
ncbi:NACHT, LRR and PYD domains-containing protein 9 isoform X3 [Mesocricetus auratus]|uniref:NACHT, LRR and PYD domains-containing protein 9 isoform X3 n=1 Tax=Mesocricetus auratus TaxID=10036 RepID=A0ABM2WGX1_MESAU|nr:NACHT, LRR and PYD domains-containing protein 9 isoform X3 [Mesocricetus auratus]